MNSKWINFKHQGGLKTSKPTLTIYIYDTYKLRHAN